jgi:hypothetical protein
MWHLDFWKICALLGETNALQNFDGAKSGKTVIREQGDRWILDGFWKSGCREQEVGGVTHDGVGISSAEGADCTGYQQC